MRVNELRIGNYVIFDETDEFSKIFELDRYEINGNFAVCFKPIPLTEEWLLKFGFIKLGLQILFEHDKFIFEWDNNCIWFGVNDEYLKIEIKYVHQLQNLYFALTNKELTLKTKK